MLRLCSINLESSFPKPRPRHRAEATPTPQDRSHAHATEPTPLPLTSQPSFKKRHPKHDSAFPAYHLLSRPYAPQHTGQNTPCCALASLSCGSSSSLCQDYCPHPTATIVTFPHCPDGKAFEHPLHWETLDVFSLKCGSPSFEPTSLRFLFSRDPCLNNFVTLEKSLDHKARIIPTFQGR